MACLSLRSLPLFVIRRFFVDTTIWVAFALQPIVASHFMTSWGGLLVVPSDLQLPL